MKKILYILVLFLMFIPNVLAEETTVNIYLFHSDECPHCNKEIKLLDKLEEQYPYIKVYKYEISKDDNNILFKEVANLLNAKVGGVPFTIIGNKYYNGYSEENSKKVFSATIEYFNEYGYDDIVGKYIENIEIPANEINEEAPPIEDYIDDYGNYTFKLPLIGEISTKNLALPLIAVIIGLIDGFNPCAMWILLFLISMLIGMKDKKRMFIIGTTFLVTSAFVYFLLMIVWLDIASILTSVIWIRSLIGVVAIAGGLFNLITTLKKKETGCSVVDNKKRTKIFEKIKKFTKEKNLFIALIGVITLAVSVNIVELACSAGLPLIFTEILSLNNLPRFLEIFYILLYIIFFLLDDLIIFFIAMITLKLTGFSNKYGKVSKIVGGSILVIMGILLIFFPDIIMLNF